MCYRWLELEEEFLVLRIVHGTLRIRAGEPADGIERLPERKQKEMRPVTVRPAEDNHALVAGRVPIRLEPGLLQHLEIRIGLRCRRHSVPRPRNHSEPPFPDAGRPEESAACERRGVAIGSDPPSGAPLPL